MVRTTPVGLTPLLVLFALIALAAWLPLNRLWGVNHLAFYSPAIRILVLLVVGLAFVPAVARAAYRAIERLTKSFTRQSRRTLVLSIVGLSLVSVLVFLQFQSATLLLGDGQFVASNAEARAASGASASQVFREIVESSPFSIGTSMLYYGVATAGAAAGQSAAASIAFFNVLLGGLLVASILSIVTLSSMPTSTRALLLSLALLTGAIQLFFGYVEEYTPLFFVAAAYVIAAVRYLHGKGSLKLPAILLLAAVALHAQGVLLAASFAYLVVLRVRPQATPRTVIVALMGGAAVAAAIAAMFTGLAKHFRPLLSAGDRIGVLSLGHWLDISNLLFLVMPMVLPVAVLAFTRRKRGPIAKNDGNLARVDGGALLLLVVGFSLLVVLGLFRRADRNEPGLGSFFGDGGGARAARGHVDGARRERP